MSKIVKLMAPKSVAVIGASRKQGSLGKMYLDAILKMNYTGKLYPINPKADEIEGIKCYADIQSLPERPDLAVILLPKDFVLPTLKELADNNINYVIVISAGFKEVGGDGIERENQLIEIIRKNNMRVVGPNSMGLFNTDPTLSFNGTFSPVQPLPGHIGFVSQSGALGVAVLELSIFKGLGFSIFVSTGNKADIGNLDILEYLTDDDNTHAAMMYHESIDNPNLFRKISTAFVKKKPLLVLKSGRTQSGLKAASSHTGALASDDIIIDTFLKQCGAIRCQTLEEIMDTALALENQPLPAGNKVAIITNAGGPGILASDALENANLQLANFSENTIQKLSELLPPEASKTNPVDMIASATHDTYKEVAQIVMSDKNVDSLFIIIVTPPVKSTLGSIVESLSSIIQSRSKPLFIVPMMLDDVSGGFEKIRQLEIPAYIFPESAIIALGNILKYKKLRESIKPFIPELHRVEEKKTGNIKRQATFEEVIKLIKNYNIPVCEHIVTNKIEEALNFLENHSKVAIKVANPEIIHKSDAGLVKLNISTNEKLSELFPVLLKQIQDNLPPSVEPKVIVQEMVSGDIELVIGAKKDEQFGPVLMFGLGGILIELFKDVAFRVLPIEKDEALSMISEIRGHKLLEGYRNIPKVNLDSLAELLVKAGKLMIDNPQIVEMDMNPLIWPNGADNPVVVDFRMTFSE